MKSSRPFALKIIIMGQFLFMYGGQTEASLLDMLNEYNIARATEKREDERFVRKFEETAVCNRGISETSEDVRHLL